MNQSPVQKGIETADSYRAGMRGRLNQSPVQKGIETRPKRANRICSTALNQSPVQKGIETRPFDPVECRFG